ncbi:hypothetical protein FA13DRAFT_1731868, partial [Coprinellus micaceus]
VVSSRWHASYHPRSFTPNQRSPSRIDMLHAYPFLLRRNTYAPFFVKRVLTHQSHRSLENI